MLVDIIFIFYLFFVYDASKIGDNFITDITVGNIESGTVIYENNKIKDIMIDMLSKNARYYAPVNIGTWSSVNDVDTFLSLHNHNNGYNGLKLGNYITINDGTYNTDWEIAGFDCEHNQLAADNTIYDNGYGICLIPKTYIGKMQWNNTSMDYDALFGGYMASTMYISHLVTVANNLKNVLGNHLINRNVLLSSSIDYRISGTGYSNAYTWTTSYCTLMSYGQLTGTFGHHRNKYDDGEANYKLPLFEYEEYGSGFNYWLRGIWGYDDDWHAWRIDAGGSINNGIVTTTNGVRPLIYLR